MLMSALSGSILKEERKKRAISQKSLAQNIGISAAYINLIESGRRQMTPRLRDRICVALKIDESRLMGEGNVEKIELLTKSEHLADFDREKLEQLVIFSPQIVDVFLKMQLELSQNRISLDRMENRVEHDQDLIENLHNLLSYATSIRSTSSILNTQGDLSAELTARFREVLHQDARELSEQMRALVDHFDRNAQGGGDLAQYDLRLVQYLEDRQYYLADFEEEGCKRADLPNWLVQEFGEEMASIGQFRRLFELFLRDIEALEKDVFLKEAEAQNWKIHALAECFDSPVDRILRRIALLSKFAPMGNVALFIQDQTGHFLLENHALSLHRSVELSCPFWPIFECEGERGKLYSASLILHENQHHKAYAAASVQSSFGRSQQAWVFRTMLVHRFQNDLELAPIQSAPQNIGFNCANCRILDCDARRNGAVSLLNNKIKQGQINENA